MFKDIFRRPAPRAAVCWITARYIRLVHALGRWTVEGAEIPEALIASGQPFLVAFWHGRMLMMSEGWRYSVPTNMVISQHADGQLIAQTIAHLGVGTLSGSTTRGGSSVMRAILRALKNGEYVGLTPDGPQGPRMRVSPGIVQAARLSGVPILPVSAAARPCRLLSSWDRLMVPMPFSRGIIRWGKPIEIDRNADDAVVVETARALEAQLNDLSAALDALMGLPGVDPAPAEAEA